jgi:hypothetical protein
MGVQPYLPYLVTGTAVLTDDIFTAYGGDLDNSTAAQRNVAYMIAEQFAIEEIGTFLVPTSISGTFAWPLGGVYNSPWPLDQTRINLPHTHVRSVTSLTTIHEAGCDCADDQVELSGCAWILDYQAGIIDLRECGDFVGGSAACSCAYSQQGEPLQFQIVYEAGIEAGRVAANPSALMGLTIAAELALEQIVDPSASEGGPGDPSLTNFSDTGYSASRQFLLMTAFGGSPRANYAARMLNPIKYKRALRL